MGNPVERHTDFSAFYAYYLGEHRCLTTRVWHVGGTLGMLGLVVVAIATQVWWLLAGALVVAYGSAWVSHAFFERNKPATFRQPLFSVLADFRMCFELLTRRRPFREEPGPTAP